MIRRLTLSFSIVFLWIVLCFGNTAQPGIRTAGGMAGFNLLFPEDSSAFQKIQMVKESIDILLYPGFAVVKGTYWMANSTEDTITIKTGYPINAFFASTKNASDLTEIYFDKLFELRVSVGGDPVTYEKKVFQSDDSRIASLTYEVGPQWYIWTTRFSPGETKIEVYFIVNTNDSSVREGYNSASPNGFIYILETGASWKPPIGEGVIRIKLKDSLTPEQIKGVSPDSVLKYSVANDYFFYEFKDLIPDHEDNLVITYSQRLKEFDFERVTKNSNNYFNQLDEFSNVPFDPNGTIKIFPSPFEVSGSGNFFVGLIMFVAVYGLPILGIIFAGLIIFWFLRRRKESINS